MRLSDSSVRYEVTVDVGRDAAGKRRQSRTRYRTLREAKVALAKTRVALNDGTHVARAVLSVRTYLEQWVEGKIDLRSSTREGYSFALKPVLARYGDLPLQQLTKTHLDATVALAGCSMPRTDTPASSGPHAWAEVATASRPAIGQRSE